MGIERGGNSGGLTPKQLRRFTQLHNSIENARKADVTLLDEYLLLGVEFFRGRVMEIHEEAREVFALEVIRFIQARDGTYQKEKKEFCDNRIGVNLELADRHQNADNISAAIQYRRRAMNWFKMSLACLKMPQEQKK